MKNKKTNLTNIPLFLLLILIIFCGNYVTFAQNSPSIFNTQKITKLKQIATSISKDPILRQGEWGCTVLDVQTGNTIVDLNGNKSLAPASNLKLLTTSAALVQFGSSHQFKTVVGYSGRITGATLNGDLIVVGGGDPTLGSTQVKGNKSLDQILDDFTNTVKKTGISKIDGKIITDVSLFDPVLIPDGWLWVDIGNYYGVGPNSLCVHDNLYYLYFKPGKKVGSPAAVLEVKPEIPGLHFTNYMKTGPVGSGDNGYIYGGTGGFTRTLRGTIPAGVNRFSIKGSIPDPALFFIQTLKKQLAKNGIKITKSVEISHKHVSMNKIILEHNSPPLSEIVYWINKKSINLYTEVLLKHLGKSKYNVGSFKNGIKALKDFLGEQGVPLAGLHLYDGSGLSPLNAITTNQMALLLKNMTTQSTFDDFFNSLPIAGSNSDDGQLGHLCRGTAAANNLRAKTGLITRVRAHSGYVKTRSGRLLCFSMIANDHTGSSRKIDRLHEKLMIQMAELD